VRPVRANQFNYKSFTKEVSKEVDRNARENLTEACKYAKGEIKAVLGTRAKSNPGSPPGKLSGRLQKSISYRVENEKGIFGETVDNLGIVGSTDNKAHLLEFGSEKMEARPFEGPTLEKISPQIKEIMSGKLVDDK
jgi:HK97 gp10 family phage protein